MENGIGGVGRWRGWEVAWGREEAGEREGRGRREGGKEGCGWEGGMNGLVWSGMVGEGGWVHKKVTVQTSLGVSAPTTKVPDLQNKVHGRDEAGGEREQEQ